MGLCSSYLQEKADQLKGDTDASILHGVKIVPKK
jgi:hypothetical protein